MTIVRDFLQWLATAPANERAEAAGTLARAYLCSDLAADELAPAEGLLWPRVRPRRRRPSSRSPPTSRGSQRQFTLCRPLLIDADLVDGVATGGDAVQAA